MPGPTVPRLAENDIITTRFLNTLAERIEKLYAMRVSPPLSFSTSGGVPMLRLSGSIDGGSPSSSTLIATCISTTTITAASSTSPPGTYGTGTATIDVDGGTGYTAGSSITVRNRFPSTWASGTLLVIASNDGGATWQVINRYCP